MSPNLETLGQVSFDKRTERERVYIQILKMRGDLTNVELRKAALGFPLFKGMDEATCDKYVDRFVEHGEYLGILSRQGRKIQLLNNPPEKEPDQPRAGQPVLHPNGFITARAGVRCRHCMKTIDLTQVEIWRRIKSDTLLRILHVHHFFWVTCPHCKVKARYDMDEDVKEVLPESNQK